MMNIFDSCSAHSGAELPPESWLDNSAARLALNNRKIEGGKAKYSLKKQPINLSKTSKSIKSNNCSENAHTMRSIQSMPQGEMQQVYFQHQLERVNCIPAYYRPHPVTYGTSAQNIPAPSAIRQVTNQRFLQILPVSNFGQPAIKTQYPHSAKTITNTIQHTIAPISKPVPLVRFGVPIQKSQKLLPSTKRIHEMQHVDAESVYDEQASLDQISILDQGFEGLSQREEDGYGKSHSHEVQTNISKSSSMFQSHGI